MAGNGPVPGAGAKPEGQRRRRNKPEPKTELDATAKVDKAPKLGGDHRQQTKDWWNAWAGSAQATLFTEPAWTRLRMLADFVDEFHNPETPLSLRKQLLAEIRLNEKDLLAMPADQARAKLDLRLPTDTGKAPPTAKAASKRNAQRKGRLLKLVEPDAQAG